MAITYNTIDNVYYGTNAERLADVKIVLVATSKFYEYDTGDVYVTNGTTWSIVGGA